MNQFFNYNPYMVQRQEVVRVNGRPGADAYQLPPNSSALLLDENNPIVFLVQTDGAGYKTVSLFSIEPYMEKPTPDVNTLEERIAKLEEMLYESNHSKSESDQRTDPVKSNVQSVPNVKKSQ